MVNYQYMPASILYQIVCKHLSRSSLSSPRHWPEDILNYRGSRIILIKRIFTCEFIECFIHEFFIAYIGKRLTRLPRLPSQFINLPAMLAATTSLKFLTLPISSRPAKRASWVFAEVVGTALTKLPTKQLLIILKRSKMIRIPQSFAKSQKILFFRPVSILVSFLFVLWFWYWMNWVYIWPGWPVYWPLWHPYIWLLQTVADVTCGIYK